MILFQRRLLENFYKRASAYWNWFSLKLLGISSFLKKKIMKALVSLNNFSRNKITIPALINFPPSLRSTNQIVFDISFSAKFHKNRL